MEMELPVEEGCITLDKFNECKTKYLDILPDGQTELALELVLQSSFSLLDAVLLTCLTSMTKLKLMNSSQCVEIKTNCFKVVI